MEKPLFTLTTKDFLTGIAPGAFMEGGVFFKADGVTPLPEAGTARSSKNGLLMAGSVGAVVGGTPSGNFISQTTTPIGSSQSAAFFGTSTNHLLKLVINSTLSNSFTDIHTCAETLTQGLEPLADTGGNIFLFYFMLTHIGRYDFAATFDDTNKNISSDYIHCTHRFFDSILYGNSTGKIGQVLATGASTFSNDTAALDIPLSMLPTDISDDGTYAIIAATDNVSCDTSTMGDTRIFFWDGYSTSWNREYAIPDPFIYSLEKTSQGVFAYGVTGIWQVSFGGVQKIFSRTPGIYSVNTQTGLIYGRPAASHFGDALLWGGTSGTNYTIKSLGKLDQSAPSAYLHPFLSTAGQNITLVSGQIVKGYVLVGDTTPQLVAYPFNTTTPNTGVIVQSIYLPIMQKAQIRRIDVVFGGPLASSDSLAVSVFKDEDTAAVSFGSATYANDGATRRKQLFPATSITVEDHVSVQLTYTAGAVKIKAVHIYGDIENA